MDIVTTNAMGHATKLAGELNGDFDAVLIVGGDGTVNEAINGLVGKEIPALVLATGTENLFARELGMPCRPDLVAATLLYGEPFPCDVGVVNGRQYFLSVVGIGFDAQCVILMNGQRRGHITHGDYFGPIWRTFWTYRFPDIVVETEAETLYAGPGFAIIGGIGRYSAGMRILPNARIDDGLLDVCVFPCASRLQLASHAISIFRRRHVGHGGVLYSQCREVRVSSDSPTPFEVDGEIGGRLPCVIGVRPGGVSFLRLPSSPDSIASGSTQKA